MEEEGYRLRYSGNLVFLWLKTRGTESIRKGVIYFAGGDILAGTTPSWIESCKKVFPRYEIKEISYLGVVMLAAIMRVHEVLE